MPKDNIERAIKKTTSTQDLMTAARSSVDATQLAELRLAQARRPA